MKTHLMKCGHAANARHPDGTPCCAICIPRPEASEVDDFAPNLTGRMAECSCGAKSPSDPEHLAFFEYFGEGSKEATEKCGNCYYHLDAHRPDRPTGPAWKICDNFTPAGPQPFDKFYCGCRGWD